jgi:hypothetical protein
MRFIFAEVQQKRLISFGQSFYNTELSGLRLYQVHLSDICQGGLTKDCFLVPSSGIASNFLDTFITPTLKPFYEN